MPSFHSFTNGKRLALVLPLFALAIALLNHFRNDVPSVITTITRDLSPDILYTNITKRDEYSCDINNPCSNGACCGGSGYCGYGPTYCGDGCVSQCNAVAECGQYAIPAGTTCPLNVCCSEYGFCGTTTDFCSDKCQSNCDEHPSPTGSTNSGDVRKRVIGYYEAWSARRDCHPMDPSMLPVDGLTHVNFAFAYIEPGKSSSTYEVTTMDDATPASLFQTTADVKTFKSGNADLEVFVSIGGWTFSDNDTVTQPLFGEIARDATKRQTFADNVVKFLDQYGFDGLDIDWEYPGAPDRGGQEDDTDNFVLLLKTIRETFDAQPRSLGLTYTIPTSYWYLRWFDLPGSLDYVDWINVMAYDLHGFWDKLNPIGSIVQGHTNLTEIKAAAELLWRVNVPPEKVVMGVGFYGRSFQLSDPDCGEPGCAFGGAANPGACTDTGGILGYFEIMDILNGVETTSAGSSASDSKKLRKRATIEPIHDEEAAVNYFTYDDDQWVSYDDNVTFQQKVDWANDLGLGGLMIWSADLDDKQYTGISGLLGQQIVGGVDDPDDGKSVAQDWSGQNGQSCRRDDDCINIDAGSVQKCLDDETLVGWDAGGCGGKKDGDQWGKPICCPVAAYPRSCSWRGGTGGAVDCNGQCHSGELTLFKSKWGGSPAEDDTDTKKCNRGNKAFCCVSDTWSDLIADCKFGSCGGGCDDGYEAVTEKHDPQICEYPYGGSGPQNRDYCCPIPKKFNNCHWVGQGDCADNTCDDNDVVLMTDSYGDGKHSCNWGRKKTCCCDSPEEQTFLPFDLDDLFPTTPSSDNYVKYDLAWPKGQPSSSNPSKAAFGLVVIDGPKSVVSSAKVKRDGSPSDLEFLDCHAGMKRQGRQSVRFVCKSDHGSSSDCDDMMVGGVAGTILAMPEGCGETYAVAHSVKLSSNQTLPANLSGIHNITVLELIFDYDFGLVKRDDGDVYFRVDYANVAGYWDEAVSADPVKRSLDRRFWSTKATAWATKFSNWLSNAGTGTTITKNIKKTIFSNVIDCGSASAYADIVASGSIEATARMAISIVGTISPTLNIEEVNAVLSSSIDANFNIDQSLYGDFTMDYTVAEMFDPITGDEFNHIGIVSIAPTLEIDIAMQADIEVAGNFTTGAHAYTSENIVQGWPKAVHTPTGQTAQQALQSPFAGSIDSIGRSGRLKIDLLPRMGMQITLNKYGTDGKELNAFVDGMFDTYNSLDVDDDGTYTISMGTTAAGGELNYIRSANEFTQWASDNEESRTIGTGHTGKVLASGSPGGDDGDDGPSSHEIIYDSSAVFADQQDVLLACPSSLKKKCGDEDYNCAYDICSKEPDYCVDDDVLAVAGGNTDVTKRWLEKRSAARPYTVVFSDGSTLDFESRPYPSIGELFNGGSGSQVIARVFDYLDENDCSDIDIIDYEVDDLSNYVTEHIIELQTVASFITAAESGTLFSGATMNAATIPASFFHVNWNNKSLPKNLPAVVSVNKFSPEIPNTRVFEALGSNRNRADFVACRAELNSVKALVWAGSSPREETKFNKAVTDWLVNCGDPAEFLKYLKAARAVFSYLDEDSDVRERMQNALATVRTQLDLIENNAGNGSGAGLVAAWDEFIEDYLQFIATFTRGWLVTRINAVQQAIRASANLPGNAATVQMHLTALLASAGTLPTPSVS